MMLVIAAGNRMFQTSGATSPARDNTVCGSGIPKKPNPGDQKQTDQTTSDPKWFQATRQFTCSTVRRRLAGPPTPARIRCLSATKRMGAMTKPWQTRRKTGPCFLCKRNPRCVTILPKAAWRPAPASTTVTPTPTPTPAVQTHRLSRLPLRHARQQRRCPQHPLSVARFNQQQAQEVSG